MGKPDYSNYTIEDLVECKEQIDKHDWPERYQEILDAITTLVEDPELKNSHDKIVFQNFCEELRRDLSLSVDDNLWAIFSLFSKRVKAKLPSTFYGEVCPICAGELNVKSGCFAFWHIACLECKLEYSIRERQRFYW